MNEWRLLTDDGAGAAEGLAADEFLMRSYRGPDLPPPVLRLYTYRSHCALVGRFQDPAAELRLAECDATGTEVNRRPTGGGAIIMGEHQLGVALATSLRDPLTPAHSRAIIEEFARGITLGLARLGIAGDIRGKNDIAVAGRKIAGLGVYVDGHDAVLFHASVLVDLDVEFMLRVLNVPAVKLADRAVASVRERITSVRAERGRDVDTAHVRACVEAGFQEAFGVGTRADRLTPEERAGVMELVAQKYGSPDWVNQRASDAPAGASILKTPGGLLRVSVGLSGDALKDVLIAGDFMAREPAVAELEAALRWAGADRARIEARVREGLERGGGLDGIGADQLTEAIWQAVMDARARRGAAGSCYYPDAPVMAPLEEARTWQ